MAARWDDDSLWTQAAPVAAPAPASAKPKAAVRWDDDSLWGKPADFGNVASSSRSTSPPPAVAIDDQYAEQEAAARLSADASIGEILRERARIGAVQSIAGAQRGIGEFLGTAAERTFGPVADILGMAGDQESAAAAEALRGADDPIKAFGEAGAEAFRGAGMARAEVSPERPEGGEWLTEPGKAARYIGGIVAESTPAMAGAIATRNPAAGAALTGASTAGQSYGQAREDDVDPTTAALYAGAQGLAEGVTAIVPLGKALDPAASAARRFAGVAAAEPAQELVTTEAQMAADEAILGREYTDEEKARARVDSLVAGAAMSVPEAGLGLAVRQPTAPRIQTGDPEVDTGAAAARRLIEAADAEAAASQPPPAAAPIPDLTQAPAGQPDALDDLLRAQEAITAEDAAREGQRAESPIPQPAPVFQAPDPGLDATDPGLPGPAADVPGPDAGPVVSVPDAGTAQAAAPEAPTAAPRVRGAAGRAFTGAGEAVDFDYAVVESDDLVPSNDAGGRVNPRYPRELQPRDRTTPESRASVAVIAKNLNPERLGESQDIVNGAPLVGDDLVVESGNGRVMALQSADQDRQGAYRQWVEANAGRFGVDAEAVRGMRSPVLVRVRRGELDMAERARLGREGNRSTALGMSPTEKAKADAALVTDDMMAAWAPSEDGDPLSASNQPFIRQFLSGLGANEAAELSSNGRLTKQAADRLQAAVFAKAYGDPRLINLFASEADPQIKNVLVALSRGAGAFARAKAKGAEDAGLDLSANLAEAASLMLDAKEKGMSVRALLDQGDMFGGGRDPVSTGLALYFADNARAPRRMGALIQAVGGLVEKELQARTSGDMFGRQDATRAEILDAAQAATAEQPARAAALLSQGQAPGRGGGEGQQPAAGRAAAGDSAGDGKAAGVAPAGQDISQELLDRFEADPDAVLAEYAALTDKDGANSTDGGRLVDTDQVRELSPAYRANRRLAGKIHRAASFITKAIYKRLLKGPVKEGRRATVYFLGGGGGSGKSTAAKPWQAAANADITFDGTLSNAKNAVEYIEDALERGRSVEIGFVFRPPLEALKTAIGRANKPNARIVPTWALAEAHALAPGVVRALALRYNGHERVKIVAIDNSGKIEDAHEIPVEQIPEVPSEQDLKRQFDEYVESQHQSGAISDELRAAFLEPAPDEGSAAVAQGDRGLADRSPESGRQSRGRDPVVPKTPPTGGVSASGATSTAAPAAATLDMPKMTASRLADLEIEVEASDGKRSKTVKVNAYKVLRRAMQRLDAINSLMECVRRG